MMLPPLVFLDVDNVLNSINWQKRRQQEGMVDPRERYTLYDLDPQACLQVQRLCEATGAEVVMSSSWRQALTPQELHALFCQRGLTIPIIGRTPTLDPFPEGMKEPWERIGRGLEIQWWLQHYLTDAEVCAQRFVILDDEIGMGDLLGKLAQTRVQAGFTDLESDYAFKHLRETLMDSAAAGGKGRVLFKYDARTLTPGWNKQEGPFGPT